jgi:arylamine N-acetyltransferase
MTGRTKYTQEQLEKYFDRVCVPKSKRVYDVQSLSDEEKFKYLHLLQKHQLVKVPWENLVQHYSWHRVVNVKPQHLFNKIVNGPGRGGVSKNESTTMLR